MAVVPVVDGVAVVLDISKNRLHVLGIVTALKSRQETRGVRQEEKGCRRRLGPLGNQD